MHWFEGASYLTNSSNKYGFIHWENHVECEEDINWTFRSAKRDADVLRRVYAWLNTLLLDLKDLEERRHTSSYPTKQQLKEDVLDVGRQSAVASFPEENWGLYTQELGNLDDSLVVLALFLSILL